MSLNKNKNKEDNKNPRKWVETQVSHEDYTPSNTDYKRGNADSLQGLKPSKAPRTESAPEPKRPQPETAHSGVLNRFRSDSQATMGGNIPAHKADRSADHNVRQVLNANFQPDNNVGVAVAEKGRALKCVQQQVGGNSNPKHRTANQTGATTQSTKGSKE